MRLIDADELLKNDVGRIMGFRECDIKNAPTVDAIPMSVIDDIKAEIKEWYWKADKQALAKDTCVVDAMVDLFIRTINKHIAESEERR